MSAEAFTQFMQDQCQAIEASGMDPAEWIEQHAEEFRNEWEATHHD